MFTSGFTKTALSHKHPALLASGVAALAGLGALLGHDMEMIKKIVHARQGKEYKPKSMLDKHPYLAGAATLGIAPTGSALSHQKDLDKANPHVRALVKKHPYMAARLGLS